MRIHYVELPIVVKYLLVEKNGGGYLIINSLRQQSS